MSRARRKSTGDTHRLAGGLAVDIWEARIATEAREVQRQRGLADVFAASWLVRPVVQSASLPDTEEGRAELWRSLILRVHGPGERALSERWGDYLEGAAKRYGERLAETQINRKTLTRQLSDSEMLQILAIQVEYEIAVEAIGESTIRAILRSGFSAAAESIGDITWNPILDPSSQILGRMVVDVSEFTKQRVKDIVVGGLDKGATISEMQAALMEDQGFSAVRALRIARTETTRTVNEGSDMAINDAANLGINVYKAWITAQDEVRDSHMALGTTDPVVAGGMFTIPPTSEEDAGAQARFPGDFGIARQDINCRCLSQPQVKK